MLSCLYLHKAPFAPKIVKNRTLLRRKRTNSVQLDDFLFNVFGCIPSELSDVSSSECLRKTKRSHSSKQPDRTPRPTILSSRRRDNSRNRKPPLLRAHGRLHRHFIQRHRMDNDANLLGFLVDLARICLHLWMVHRGNSRLSQQEDSFMGLAVVRTE